MFLFCRIFILPNFTLVIWTLPSDTIHELSAMLSSFKERLYQKGKRTTEKMCANRELLQIEMSGMLLQVGHVCHYILMIESMNTKDAVQLTERCLQRIYYILF